MSRQTKQELQQELAAVKLQAELDKVKAEHETCPEIKAAHKYEQYVSLLDEMPKFEQERACAHITQSGDMYVTGSTGYSNSTLLSREVVPAFLQWCSELRGDTPVIKTETLVQIEYKTLKAWKGALVGGLITFLCTWLAMR